VDRDGNPVVKVQVVIAPVDENQRSYPVKTNKNGEYFAMVRSAAYKIEFVSEMWTLDTLTMVIESRRSNVPGVPESGGKMRPIYDWSGKIIPGQPAPPVQVAADDRATVDLVVVAPEVLRKEQIDMLLARTAQALNRDDREAAMGTVKELLEKDPDDVLGLTLRAYIHAQEGNLEAAEVDLLAALEHDPSMYDAQYQLATVYRSTDRIDQAVEAYGRAAADADSGENKAKALLSIGELERDAGNMDRAIEAFEQAIVANPELKQVVAPELASLYTAAGDIERATEWIEAAGTGGAVDPALQYNVGVAHFNKKEWEQAAECFRTVLSVKPELADAHKNLATALLNLGQQDESLEHFRRYLALQPEADDAGQIQALVDNLSQ
jgi:tetratricopeptide (TPR) repeat protein